MFSFGEKWFYGKSLKLEWWNPFAGCLLEEKRVRKVWVRVLGLPLHMWGKGLFKRLGEECGSFVAIGEDMAECRNFLWVRIPLRLKGGRCLLLCKWWWVLLVSRDSCGGRFLLGGARCRPCGVAKWRGKELRVRQGHVSSREWQESSLTLWMTRCRCVTRCFLLKGERELLLK